MTREELLYAVGKGIGYWTGHYDGWTDATEWTRRYFQISDYFIRASQAGVLIAMARKNISVDEIGELGDCAYDPKRGEELAAWIGREAGAHV